MDVDTFEALEALRTDLSRMGDRLEAAFREGIAPNRGHSDVIAESLRDDVRIVAEGVVSLDARGVSLSSKVDALDGKVDALDRKVAVLDGKVQVIDGKVEVLLQRAGGS